MRIRFVHTRYRHWGDKSGYAQFVRRLDPAAVEANLVGTPDDDAEAFGGLRSIRSRLAPLVRRSNMPWYKLSDLQAELAAFASALAYRADIVHFLDGEHAPRFLPAMLERARLRRVRVIATYHQPAGLLKDLVDPWFLRRLDQVVLVSPSQLPWFSRFVSHERLHVLLHGIDTEFFHPAEEQRAESALRCITVGHWLRDWHILRAVAKELPDVTFEVVTGRSAALADLPNVVVHSRLSDEALAALYRTCDVLFLPLLESTANNALLEGMASGLPILSTKVGGTPAYLPEGTAQLLPPVEPGPYAAALRRLREDPPLRAALGRRARERAEKLSWESIAPSYVDLYRHASPTS